MGHQEKVGVVPQVGTGGCREAEGLTVGCCAGAGWVPLPPEELLCRFAARLALGERRR